MLLGILCLVIWLYLLFGHGWFWRVQLRSESVAGVARVIAIVPARNEAAVVAQAIGSLLAQNGVEIRVILVDDNSDDGTAETARLAAAATGKADRLTILRATPPPSGWTGKLWAVQQGTDLARDDRPDFYLLTDADIDHSPECVSSLVAIAERGKYDLASYMVKLECQTLAERLQIPAFVYFFFQLYPPKWVNNPKSDAAAAAGGCMLIRPEALLRAGAMESIRAEIIDDCALAREVKRADGKLWLGLTRSAKSIRPYQSFREIERMIARSAFNQLRHSWVLLIIAIAALLLTYVVPVILLAGPWWPFGVLAFASMVITYWPMVRFYGLHPLWALTLPVTAIFYMGATLDSAIRYWTGTGGQWKGRAQDRRSRSAS